MPQKLRVPTNGEARPNISTPEEKLWTAVLRRAWEDFRFGLKGIEYQNKEGKLKLETRIISEYFYSDDIYIGSFRWICEQLYDDPPCAISAIRKAARGFDISRKPPS